jgi:L-ascorbate metabolism protein UlaG (beta-lactamase superfamily)
MEEKMMKKLAVGLATAALIVGCAEMETRPVGPGTVKITPLGSHDGELCPRDRAMVLEDPDGTRILYDAGFTVRGPNDPRLGKIDAVLLSHVHGDHLGAGHQSDANAGTCGNPSFSVNVTPNSTTTMIAAAKKSVVFAGSDMHTFLAAKVKAAGGDPKQVQLVRFGALGKIGGVTIATVPATHTNGVGPEFLDKPLGDLLRGQGLNVDVGPPVGYVVQFTNGLVAYLSGDTGITAEQDVTVRRYYKANLAVMNIGGTPFTTGPHESAFVIADLVKPNAVIASHVNEVATKGGKVVPGSKTEQFMKRVGIPTYIPLSGRTMSIDGSGRCVSGC